MKLKTLLLVALAAAVPAMSFAKKPKKVSEETPVEAQAAQPEEDPVITEECVMNVSLFHESVKNKMYADAYGPWWEVYTTCPNANKSIYSDGAKIVEALYQAASDPAEKERLAKLAIEMQDKRIRFFGNDPEKVPAKALSVGVGTVCDSREVLLLVNGHNKARALAHCVEGGVSSKWTISALQNHNNAYIACDEAACGELKVDTYRYFKDVYASEIL